MIKKIRHILEYVIFQLVGFFVRLLPLNCIYKFAFTLGKFFFHILKSRRLVALSNLKNAFPNKSDDELKKIALQSFQNVTATFIELLWYPNFNKEIIKQRVKLENLELIEKLLQKKKGLIYLTAHIGSWELAVQSIAVNSCLPVCAMAKTQSNLFVNKIITKWREKFGAKIVSMNSVRDILRYLQEGNIVALVADQSAPRESIWIKFFGREVPTFQGPSVFALKTGAPIVFGGAIRQKDGSYIMKLTNIEYDDLKGDFNNNVIELTRRQVKYTEDLITQYPEQWMWMHKRWKHVSEKTEIK